jgi:L-malate glycosyltransferase
MRILFVNHTGACSGAELALMHLVERLSGEHDVALACPPDGPLAQLADEAGVERFSVPAAEPSLRLHPVQTPLGLARLGRGGVTLARVARRFGPDLAHANTPRAGLMGAVARRVGGPPLVVRVHDPLPPTLVGRAVRSVLARSAGAIVTVSRDTARRFNEGLARPLATHVYNAFDRDRFDRDRVSPAPLREQLGLSPNAAVLAQVAQITPWKGQDTAIRAVARLRRDGLDAHLLLVGDIAFSGKAVRYDNQAFLAQLHRLVDELAIGGAVHFLGKRDDVPGILSAVDLSLLPSWYEPFANVMLESMALGTPLLASAEGGAPEVVEDGVSGRLLPPKRPDLWAAAASELLADRDALTRMGEQASAATKRFDDESHVRAMLEIYGHVLGAQANRSARGRPVEVG